MLKLFTLTGGLLMLTFSLHAQCTLPSGAGCGMGPTLTGTIDFQGDVTLPGTYGRVLYSGLSGVVEFDLSPNITITLGNDLTIADGTTLTITGTTGNQVIGAGGTDYTKTGDPNFNDLAALLSSCTDPAGCTVGSILPVTLLSWTAVPGNKEDHVILTWSSAIEDDNDYYFIEHGTDGVNFQEIARLSGEGSEAAGADYVYEHTNLSGGEHFYRLGQRDFDGATARFDIRSVMLHQTGKLAAYPNPARPGAFINVEGNQVRLMDMTGKEISIVSDNNNDGFQLPASVRPGVYLLMVAGKTTRLVVR